MIVRLIAYHGFLLTTIILDEKPWVMNDAYDNLPESGYAWLVVLGAFCSYFTTLGIETSW